MKIPRLTAVLLLSAWPLAGQQFEIYKQFVWTYGGPADKLVVASDGRIYGITGGGEYGQGQIQRWTPDGGGGYTLERLYSFHGPTDGREPYSLMQGLDGHFYGTTYLGGAHNAGTVFSFDPAAGLVVLHAFAASSFLAVRPYRPIQASDGNLYGTTLYGGASGSGMVYRLTPNGVFTDIHDFGGGPEGVSPPGPLVQASDGFLYGTTTYDIAFLAAPNGDGLRPKGVPPLGYGSLFRIDTSGVLTVLHHFDPSEAVFSNAELVEGADGYLYGSAYGGGSTSYGTIYRSDKLGNLVNLHSFDSAAGEGRYPEGGLTQASDGTLFGVTLAGGTADGGAVFRIAPSGDFGTVANFPGADPSVIRPYFGLALAPDGALLGLTLDGGLQNAGVAFRAVPPQTGFEVIHEFGEPTGVTHPSSELTQTSDGTLWGTAGGGAAELGTIYRLSGGPLIAHEFDGADGASPGNLLAASDGDLYGITASQGAGGSGTVYRLDSTGAFTTLHDFSGADGAEPAGGLMQASDGNLYGVTAFGGANGGGTLFRLTTSGTHTKLHDFQANAVPEQPRGRILQASDGQLYGTNFGFSGAIYQSDLQGNVAIVHDFFNDWNDGTNPPTGLIEASDGNLYGTCRYFGTGDSLGTVFRFGPPSTYAVIHDFEGEGRTLGGVVQASDGRLYGTTTGEMGSTPYGGVFSTDLSGSDFQTLHTLSGADGGSPAGSLLQASDGMLYGTTQTGGWASNLGLVFRVDLTNAPPSVDDLAPASGTAFGGVPLTILGNHLHPDAGVSVGGAPFDVIAPFDTKTLFALTPALTPGTLYDVTVTNTDGQSATLPQAFFADFLDSPTGSLFHGEIESIFRGGITAGCGGGSYCGNAAVTRAQMAVFVLKFEHGPGYAPPPCAGVFPDVPCPSMFADWIEQFATEKVTAGCGGGLYCPNGTIPRENAAVFLLKAEHGGSYVPPACTGVFDDVPCPSQYADWIEQLVAEGISGGCGNGNYCPGANTTRGQMAAFLEKTAAKAAWPR